MTHRLVLATLVAALSVAGPGLAAGEKERTLQRLARVAELYRDNALGFACQETITYTGEQTGRMQFAYLFVRDASGRLHDFRTWKTTTKEKDRVQEVSPADYHVPLFLESAYLWAFVFRSDRQPRFDFELRATEPVHGRSAVKIQFTPREPIRKGINDWGGYAWVDSTSTQILEVEAYSPSDWRRKLQRDADAASAHKRDGHADRKPYDFERIVTTFGFEKNGIRFPSRVESTKIVSTIKRGASLGGVSETVRLRVVQEYSLFEFFSVRTSEEITRFVNGEGPLRPVK